MTTARVIAYMGYMLLFPGVFFSHSMNRVLVYIFYSQFKKLKRSFHRTLDEQGKFTGDLSLFRRRHQTLSRAVSKVDGFVKFGNVAGFVCHIANTILLIYSLIFQPESRNNFISASITLFWLVINISGLMFSASAGIVVNHAVRIHIQGRRSHRIIGGHKRRLWEVPQKLKLFCETTDNICIKIQQTTLQSLESTS